MVLVILLGLCMTNQASPYHGGDDIIKELDDGHFCAHTGPDGAHFQANVAAADDKHLLGNLLQR